MSENAEDAFETPPLMPEAETPVEDHKALSATCLSATHEFVSRMGLTLGTPVLTQSERWGLVWRVDFTVPGESLAPLINRIACWQPPGGEISVMLAVGQCVAPLGSASQSR